MVLTRASSSRLGTPLASPLPDPERPLQPLPSSITRHGTISARDRVLALRRLSVDSSLLSSPTASSSTASSPPSPISAPTTDIATQFELIHSRLEASQPCSPPSPIQLSMPPPPPLSPHGTTIDKRARASQRTPVSKGKKDLQLTPLASDQPVSTPQIETESNCYLQDHQLTENNPVALRNKSPDSQDPQDACHQTSQPITDINAEQGHSAPNSDTHIGKTHSVNPTNTKSQQMETEPIPQTQPQQMESDTIEETQSLGIEAEVTVANQLKQIRSEPVPETHSERSRTKVMPNNHTHPNEPEHTLQNATKQTRTEKSESLQLDRVSGDSVEKSDPLHPLAEAIQLGRIMTSVDEGAARVEPKQDAQAEHIFAEAPGNTTSQQQGQSEAISDVRQAEAMKDVRAEQAVTMVIQEPHPLASPHLALQESLEGQDSASAGTEHEALVTSEASGVVTSMTDETGCMPTTIKDVEQVESIDPHPPSRRPILPLYPVSRPAEVEGSPDTSETVDDPPVVTCRGLAVEVPALAAFSADLTDDEPLLGHSDSTTLDGHTEHTTSPHLPMDDEPLPPSTTLVDVPAHLSRSRTCTIMSSGVVTGMELDDENSDTVLDALLQKAREKFSRNDFVNGTDCVVFEPEHSSQSSNLSRPLVLDALRPLTGPGAQNAPLTTSVPAKDRFGMMPPPPPKVGKKSEKSKKVGWHDLPQQEITPEVKREIQALRLHATLDPKRFVKGGIEKSLKAPIPERFLFGHVMPSSSSSSSSAAIPKKRSFVESLVADEEAKAWAKRKYVNEVQVGGASGGKGFWKGLKKKRTK